MDQTHIQIHVDPAEAIVGGADQTLKFTDNGTPFKEQETETQRGFPSDESKDGNAAMT